MARASESVVLSFLRTTDLSQLAISLLCGWAYREVRAASVAGKCRVRGRWVARRRKRAVYALFCPLLHVVRYVGLSCNPRMRLYSHCHRQTNQAMRQWIADLKSRGLSPELQILEYVTGEDGPDAERRWIAHYAGHYLLNVNLAKVY